MSNATGSARSNSQANDEENSESLRGWIAIVLSVFLVCTTTALFTAGHGYQLGYWYELGFDLAQLPTNFHETLFLGFSGGGPLLIAWLIGGLIALSACGILTWLATMLWNKARNRWSPLRRITLPSPKPRPRVETHVKLILGAVLLLPAIYLIAMAYIAMAEFQNAGTKKGKELVAALRTDAAAASAKYGTQKVELWFSAPSGTCGAGVSPALH